MPRPVPAHGDPRTAWLHQPTGNGSVDITIEFLLIRFYRGINAVTDLERFKAICNFEKPDYVPIFGIPGSSGMSGGLMRFGWERLVEQGMPDWVDGCVSLDDPRSRREFKTWHRYWGTTGPVTVDFFPGDPAAGVASTKRTEGDREIIEYETGALTRQVIDNDVTYSMPDYVIHHVKDRKTWTFYRDRATPGKPWSSELLDHECRRFDRRDRPLSLGIGGTWGRLRGLMGPAAACTVLYDDPNLAHEIIEWYAWLFERYMIPVIERLKPELVGTGEDCCYNHGMLVSPAQFEHFCGDYYRKVSEVCRDNGVTMIHIDTDGNAMEFTGLARSFGMNAIHPYEVKAGNDLFSLREQYSDFILMGGLEKECVNEGNDKLIADEILGKVPLLLESGGYFPNGDHGLQPLVTFESMCKFMTLLHDVCGNPEGEFPRVKLEAG